MQDEKTFAEAELGEKVRAECEEKERIRVELERLKSDGEKNVSFLLNLIFFKSFFNFVKNEFVKCALTNQLTNTQLCDDTKKLESELAQLTNQCAEQMMSIDQLRSEMDLIKAAKDTAELEKEEKSIKVLILSFRRLSLAQRYNARNIHTPQIGWGQACPPELLPLPPSPPPTPEPPFILTPSRLIFP